MNKTVSLSNTSLDWKRQFKIRQNWAEGDAKCYEMEFSIPSSRPILAEVQNGIIFTVDYTSGLRAWSRKNSSSNLISQVDLDNSANPSSFASENKDHKYYITIGYDNGSMEVYRFQEKQGIVKILTKASSDSSTITAIALAMPYVVTTTLNQDMELYQIFGDNYDTISSIYSLRSESSYTPKALSLRKFPGGIVATIAYSFSRLNAGWCLGLQEIRLTTNGAIFNSRLTSTINTALEKGQRYKTRWQISTRSASSTPFVIHPNLMSPPTSISYNHPWLLVSLSDNTLASYMVTSDPSKLEILKGRRLWGHTSGVSSAEVSSQGKAVSISSRGDEIRIWELEDVLTSISQKYSSIKVKSMHNLESLNSAIAERGSGLGLAIQEMKKELSFTRHWVGFDDEQVVILGERDSKQVMSCYDFT